MKGLPCKIVAHCLQFRVRGRLSVSGDIPDEGTTADSPKQLTVTMIFIVVLQLLELQIQDFLVHRVRESEIEHNFV
jgi:hypothetical protein